MKKLLNYLLKEDLHEDVDKFLENERMYYLVNKNSDEDTAFYKSCNCSRCKFYEIDGRIIEAYPKALFENNNSIEVYDEIVFFDFGRYENVKQEQMKTLFEMMKSEFTLTSFWFLDAVIRAYDEESLESAFERYLYYYKMNSHQFETLIINKKHILYEDGKSSHEIKLEDNNNLISWTWKTTSDYYLKFEFYEDKTIKVSTNRGRFGYFKSTVYAYLEEILN